MILTFYSYKGGVGRSMALANVGDLLARRGLRVLMIDFDLEAPGLEQYFPIDHGDLRGRLGLLDLILRYKHAMSLGSEAAGEKAEFRKLRELFIAPVYDQLPSGGRLDLLPAGQRGTDEELSRYALALRTFDWQDFYFNWAGELFFEWLRRTLVPGLYDVVLVDSRTGVTEMGGICAYQLADALVVLCAANHQSVEGTANVVRNFFSERVRELRRSRPLEVLVVPARIEQRDEEQVKGFRERFERSFATFTPSALKKAGTSFWNLLIPYEPRYALEEQVITDPGRAADRQKMAGAFRHLVEAVTLLSEPGSKLRETDEQPHTELATAEPQYDVARRFARFDVFLSHAAADKPVVEELARRLLETGIEPFLDKWHLIPGEPWQDVIESALEQSSACAVFLGAGKMGPWQNEEMRAALDARSRGGKRIIPVLLPGADLNPESLPVFLRHMTWVDFRAGLDDPQAFSRFVAGIRGVASGPAPQVEIERGSPFRGLEAFEEKDEAFFFGREELVDEMADRAQERSLLAVVGPSGSGKSSLVRAGLIPAFRRAAAAQGEEVRFAIMRPGSRPLQSLARALSSLTDRQFKEAHFEGHEVATLLTLRSLGGDPFTHRWVLVIDPLEEIWTLQAPGHELTAFLNFLYHYVAVGANSVLVLVFRSDFLPRVSEHRELAAVVERSVVLVGPMRENELRRAIEFPARNAGLAFEPGLVDLILEDVKGSPGALPLLQFALLELWERRRQGFLTLDAYQQIRGTVGALATKADAVFESYDERRRKEIRRILLRLVQPGEGGSDTRRRVLLQDLVLAGGADKSLRSLIEPLVEARLLTVTFEPEVGSYIELSHEALLHAWPRLAAWIDQERESLRSRRRLEDAAREWVAENRNKDFLWRGRRLNIALKWMSQAEVTDLEREFLTASQSLTQRLFRFRWLEAVIVALGLFTIVWTQWSSGQELIRKDAELRLKTLETDIARQAAVRSEQAASTTYGPDGLIFIGSSDGTGEVRDKIGERLLSIALPASRITSASFSPDGSTFVAGGQDGTMGLWDLTTGYQRKLGPDHKAPIRALAFTVDSGLLATGDDDGVVRLWNARDGTAMEILRRNGSGVINLRFKFDGKELWVTTADGLVISFPIVRFWM